MHRCNAWIPPQLQVWEKLTVNKEDCEGIRWFHYLYRQNPQGTIYHTNLRGRINRISKIWHRIYPKFRLVRNRNNPDNIQVRPSEN